MAVDGVMISFNYSEQSEHSKILTVATSGIKLGDRWVLAHGSMLYPIKEAKMIKNLRGKAILNEDFYSKLPEVHVSCEKNSKSGNLYDSVEMISRDRNYEIRPDMEHDSYLIRIFTGRICHVWQCPSLAECVEKILYSWTIGIRDGDLDEQTELGKTLISVFVLIDLECDTSETRILRPLSALLDMVRPPPDRGSSVEIHSSPFGCESFINTATRGLVCGLIGKRPTIMLTDAATALGCEGAPVFTDGPTKELVGIVICSLSWCRGEWVGLTLVAPLVSLLATKLRVPLPRTLRLVPDSPQKEIIGLIDSCTMQVRCGVSWGTGLYLGAGYVLTCAHVVRNHETNKVTVYCQSISEQAIVRYKTADDGAYDIAVVYSNPHVWGCKIKPVLFADGPVHKGEPVLAAGYPYFSENNVTDLRPTVTTGHVNNVSPTLMQTSCCVQSGFSGGPIFRITRNFSIEVIAMLVSNAKTTAGASFPYVNMGLPVRLFKPLLQQFMIDKDLSKLRAIDKGNEESIRAQWSLMPYRSKI